MTNWFFARMATALGCVSLLCSMLGCGAAPTRAQDPARYKLLDSGKVPRQSSLQLVECLTDAFAALNSGNTAFSVRQSRRAESIRVEVYVSQVNLAVSADVFDDGRTELHMAPDPLNMFSKEPQAYRACVDQKS